MPCCGTPLFQARLTLTPCRCSPSAISRSASTAIKRYMQLCRIEKTESCLSPLDSAFQLSPVADKWRDYFVFTFVRRRLALLLFAGSAVAACPACR